MTPYVESGRAAERKLERKTTSSQPERQRLMSNLRGLKQVINTFGIAGILLIPAIGIIAQSAFMAALVAGHFFVVICGLELVERGIKRELSEMDEARVPQNSPTA